jgi:dolichyl-phosphate beta-glucosyltransferase
MVRLVLAVRAADRMLDDAPTLSLVIPAFNEAPRFSDRAERLTEATSRGVFDPGATEVIVVDDGSTDETAHLAQLLLAPTFPRLHILKLAENSGKGAAIRTGTNIASAPVVAFMDADMSVDPSQIPLLLAAIESADVAIGSRAMTDSTVAAADFRRVVMGRTFNLLANAVTNVGLKDTQCGFKAFRTPVARLLFHLMVVDRFAFDVEVLWLARQLGMQISEVPVQWRDSPNSTIRPVMDSMSMAMDVCRIHWRKNRPQIPALVVEADEPDGEAMRERTLARAFATFRQTDPVLPLGRERALVLLPLCHPDEVQGTAHRLSSGPTGLSVQKRSISCDELIKMVPLPFAYDANTTPRSTRPFIPGLTERRRTLGSAREIRRHGRNDLEPSSSGEV